jgi:hypothetical protein
MKSVPAAGWAVVVALVQATLAPAVYEDIDNIVGVLREGLFSS